VCVLYTTRKYALEQLVRKNDDHDGGSQQQQQPWTSFVGIIIIQHGRRCSGPLARSGHRDFGGDDEYYPQMERCQCRHQFFFGTITTHLLLYGIG
jgi:hypothetical protein